MKKRVAISNGEWRIANLKNKIRNPQSAIRNADLSSYLVGGVNSPVRAFRHVGTEPLLLSRSLGAYVWDRAGKRYTDFIMGWGAIILGHNPPRVVDALKKRLAAGALLGLTHEAEGKLAWRIAQAVPSVEQVRFTVSGTEACMTAVKIARAHTRRSKVLVFDGCYHGHGETLMAGHSAGLPQSIAEHVVSVPFNDTETFDRALQHYATELACVIVEPVAANMGVVLPQPGFLDHIRKQTKKHGVVLIFDEVVTGFRLGFWAAQSTFGVQADLTAFGKIIGGGLPVGAVGGRRELMQRLAPEGDVYHGGTFAGHPLTMAAGLAVLESLDAQPPYEAMERLAQALAEGLSEAARGCGIALQINRMGSMLALFFSDHPVRNFADVKAMRKDLFVQWANGLRKHGVLIPPSPFEALFLSAAHGEGHITQLIRESRRVFPGMKAD